jgi:hypothetical protein
MADYWDELSQEAREEIELGDASMEALRRGETLERWLNIGRALVRMQSEAMHLARSNIAKGRHYTDAWRMIAMHAPHLKDIDQGARSHAVWLASNWETVLPWWRSLGPRESLKLNHPRSVHRRYDLAHQPPEATPQAQAIADATKPPMRQDDPLEVIRMLRSCVFPPGTAMSVVADALEAGLNFDTLKRLHTEIGKRIANAERQDRIEAGVKQRGRKSHAG